MDSCMEYADCIKWLHCNDCLYRNDKPLQIEQEENPIQTIPFAPNAPPSSILIPSPYIFLNFSDSLFFSPESFMIYYRI